MDNKKTWAVFCAACLIALIVGLGMYIYIKKTSAELPVPPLNQENEISLPPEDNTNQSVSEEFEQTPEEKKVAQPVKKVIKAANSQPMQTPKEIPLIQVEEVVKQPLKQPAQLPEVYQEKDSTDIVITTEYKIKSPAKYSFK